VDADASRGPTKRIGEVRSILALTLRQPPRYEVSIRDRPLADNVGHPSFHPVIQVFIPPSESS
jgi:hypothetical protein